MQVVRPSSQSKIDSNQQESGGVSGVIGTLDLSLLQGSPGYAILKVCKRLTFLMKTYYSSDFQNFELQIWIAMPWRNLIENIVSLLDPLFVK